MGFRSNFIAESYGAVKIPKWFLEKYPDFAYDKDKEGVPCLAMSQLWESKYYLKLSEDERMLDIQKLAIETDLNDLVVILLHECGGITRVKITKDSITAREPVEWKEVEGVEHSYCYGCSDVKNK